MRTRPRSSLKPTLWRTCRVLASPVRLRMLRVLFRDGEMTVSAVAGKVGISCILASYYLRALGARGLLASRRKGRWVYYRPAGDPSVHGADELLRALRKALKNGQKPIDAAFRHATAFTHPRRIEIARALADKPLPVASLVRRTRISRFALQRHLVKLLRRGLVKEKEGYWHLVRSREPLTSALMRLACRR